MNIRVVQAMPSDEKAINELAKLSKYTKDFANPPLSLKEMRRVAIHDHEVYIAIHQPSSGGPVIAGFCWCRPMKPKHMPFSTIYYMGVRPGYQGAGVARALVKNALERAKNKRIELVCEDGNTRAAAFYSALRFQPEYPSGPHHTVSFKPIRTGTVGKDPRPYTRWRMEKHPS